jgi:uncharacterized damage-inducible protein DinB
MATLAQRLLRELKDIRDELQQVVRKFQPEEFHWQPRPGMKSAKDLLQEIGRMEKICMNVAMGGPKLEWQNAVSWSGTDVTATLEDLAAVRTETVRHLQSTSDERLHNPIQLPDSWHQYFAGPTVELEEIIRWVARHEYYHLGQLITYRWLLGYNPYHETT